MAHIDQFRSAPVVETTTGGDRTMVLNMGPQHPSTHGVLRLLLEIDGETIVRIRPDIGFLAWVGNNIHGVWSFELIIHADLLAPRLNF